MMSREVQLSPAKDWRHLDVPVASISPGDAGEHFTWLAYFSRLTARRRAS